MLLIVDKKCTTVKYAAGVLQIHRELEETRTVAVSMLEQVVIYGNALVESSVYRALAAAAVPTTLVATRGKQQNASLSAGLATQLPLRRAQHRCANEPQVRLDIAKALVQMKLQSYRAAVSTLLSLGVSDEDIEAFLEKCRCATARLEDIKKPAGLLGVEGSMAQMWFVLLSRAIPIDFKFTGRNRRPPRDPVNAMLSLGYTLLHADVLGAVEASGLDPSLGFLHSDYPGRSSMALDMCEPLRIGVDMMVLQLIATGTVTAEHFYYREKTGCRLSKECRPRFFQGWAKQRRHWPRPVNSDDASPWPTAGVAELATGQIHQLRSLIKQSDPGVAPGSDATTIEFDEWEDDSD